MQAAVYGRKLALLTHRRSAVGAETVKVDTGIVTFTHSELLLDRGLRKRPFRLRSDWMSRVELVDRAIAANLGDAEVMLSLSDAELSEQERAALN
ncbi:MAG: hypothetical protein ACREEV_18700 [Dongiaceae bacterium]